MTVRHPLFPHLTENLNELSAFEGLDPEADYALVASEL